MDFLQFLLDKNNIFIVAVAVAAGVALALPNLRKGRGGSAVSTAEAIQMSNQHARPYGSTCARPSSTRAGHIAQARSLPAAEVEQKAAGLPKNKPLILVCEQGRDASRIAARLRAQGFADVATLDGGMRAWFAAGLPVTQKG